MNPFETVDIRVILSGRRDWIGPEIVEKLTHHPLVGVETEFPHATRSITSPDELPRPKNEGAIAPT